MNRKIVAVLWEDHVYVDRDKIPRNPDDVIATALSVGILYKETEKAVVIVNSIETYHEHDDASYTIILKSTIQSMKVYGNIEVEDLRE